MATTRKITRKKRETAKILEAVNNLEPQAVIEEIGVLQNTLQSTLAGLSAQIASKVEQMKNVDTAIEVKSADLEELYAVEKEIQNLEEIRLRRFEEDENWNKQTQVRQLDWNEEDEEREKDCQRQAEEHAYMHSQRVQRSQEEYNVEISTRRRTEGIRQDNLNREWDDREVELKAKEQKFVDLQADVDGFPDKLKADVAKAEAIVGNRVKRDYEHQIAMFNKDFDAERNLNATKVSALDDTINNMSTQIENLQTQLNSARADAKDVTNAALHSASGHSAMQALQRVVDSTGHQSLTKGK